MDMWSYGLNFVCIPIAFHFAGIGTLWDTNLEIKQHGILKILENLVIGPASYLNNMVRFNYDFSQKNKKFRNE